MTTCAGTRAPACGAAAGEGVRDRRPWPCRLPSACSGGRELDARGWRHRVTSPAWRPGGFPGDRRAPSAEQERCCRGGRESPCRHCGVGAASCSCRYRGRSRGESWEPARPSSSPPGPRDPEMPTFHCAPRPNISAPKPNTSLKPLPPI